MAERRKIIALAAFGCIVLRIAAATPVTVTVGDVTALTNKIATVASGSTILLEKGVYDISDCRGYLMGPASNCCISIRQNQKLTLAGVPGTVRGDVIITAPRADRRMIDFNKGTLACTNITFAVASEGAINCHGDGTEKLYFGNCVFSNLTADTGAAIKRYYSTASTMPVNEFRDCIFADCHATNGGCGAHNFRNGNAYDCVYSNCTCTASGGATTAGNYVRCRFYDCSTTTWKTDKGGGAIGVEYDNHIGFCTDCEFVGCATLGGRDPSSSGSGHGAAIQKATALTNCVWTAEARKDDKHTDAAYARTVGCQLLPDLKLNVRGPSNTAPFYEMPRVEFIRSGGFAADDIRAAVGERDLAGNRHFAENGTISIGCYQHRPTHFKITLR